MDGLRVYHDSQNADFRKPFGAVEKEQKVKLSIVANRDLYVVVELIQPDGILVNKEMSKEYLNNGEFRYSVEIDTTNYVGLLEYYFILSNGYEKVYYGNNDEKLGGLGQIYNYNPITYQITVYEKSVAPDWYKEGIIYQIFVDRFCNGNEDNSINFPKKNSFIYGSWYDTPMYIKDASGGIARWDFFGGNLKGVIEKLDYIKSLGASIIYLNPIFKAASCHKYDTGDYEVIDEMFGTNEDFKLLCQKARDKGIRIVLDGVFSHTGSDSKYFNKFGNYSTVGAYQSTDSKYYKWYRFNKYPNEYESWWGIDTQPNVEELEPSYLEYIVKGKDSIVKKWLRLGASGWRLDVADELPDKFIEEVKKSNILIGEVWEDASNKVSYSKRRRYLYGKELDSVTNYPLRENLINFVKGYIDSDLFKKRIMSLYENYPRENFYSNMNILGTHDTERILTVLDKRKELLKLIVVMQMTLPGVPLIFYGDEAGLEGWKDPDNRKTYPWGKEDEELIRFYKDIIKLRNSNISLKKGDFRIFDADPDVLVFEREYEDKSTLIIINRSSETKTIKNINAKGKYKDLISNKIVGSLSEDNSAIDLKGYEFKILSRV